MSTNFSPMRIQNSARSRLRARKSARILFTTWTLFWGWQFWTVRPNTALERTKIRSAAWLK